MKTKLLKIFKVIICLGVLLVIGVSVFGCGEKDNICELGFDLSDPKEIWEGTIEDLENGEFVGSSAAEWGVLVTFRKSLEQPKLGLEHFNFINAFIILYYPEFNAVFSHESINLWPLICLEVEESRQYALIFLREYGYDMVIDAIRHLDTLCFVKYAEPIYGVPNNLQ